MNLVFGAKCLAVLSVTTLLGILLIDHRAQAEGDPLAGLTLDPKIGLPQPSISVKTPLQSSLWIYGGQCSQCSLQQIDPARRPAKYFDSIVILYSADSESLPSLQVPKNVYLVADPKAEIFAQLNPLWIGRWYIFKSAALTDLQKSPDQAPPWPEDQ